MNSDHTDAIRHYCAKVSLHVDDVPEIVGINAYGFHVKVQQLLYWFAFDTPCGDVSSVREALVTMARR